MKNCYLSGEKFLIYKLILSFWRVVLFSLIPAVVHSDVSIGIYGLSTHNDDNGGKGYQERNWGLSFHPRKEELGPIFYQWQVGAFRNSFDDLAAWAGVEVGKQVSKYNSLILDIRHWETLRGTYTERLLVPYPKLRFHIDDKLSLDWLVRKSGHIFSIRYDFE